MTEQGWRFTDDIVIYECQWWPLWITWEKAQVLSLASCKFWIRTLLLLNRWTAVTPQARIYDVANFQRTELIIKPDMIQLLAFNCQGFDVISITQLYSQMTSNRHLDHLIIISHISWMYLKMTKCNMSLWTLDTTKALIVSFCSWLTLKFAKWHLQRMTLERHDERDLCYFQSNLKDIWHSSGVRIRCLQTIGSESNVNSFLVYSRLNLAVTEESNL